jgi:hypothetical protein
MTTPELIEFTEKFYQTNVDTMKRKNADYTGADNDPFKNFKAIETLGIPTEQGFLTRMLDKLMRISSFVQNGELLVKDESVQDTLSDLSVYSAMFAAFIESKKV